MTYFRLRVCPFAKLATDFMGAPNVRFWSLAEMG